MIGDLVIVQDNKEKQGFWKLGLVEVIPGEDGEVKGACKHFRRPIQHLYPLKTNCFSSESGKDKSTNKVTEASNPNHTEVQCELSNDQSRELVTQRHSHKKQLNSWEFRVLCSETPNQANQLSNQISCRLMRVATQDARA